MSSDGDEASSSQLQNSQSPFSPGLESTQYGATTPGSSAGNGSLPSQLPRSLTRSASSLVADGGSSSSRSAAPSPARASSQQSDHESRSSSLSRSRPSFGGVSDTGSENFGPAVLSPPFESPALEGENQDLPKGQPRSFDKMQDSILSDTSTASGIVDKISLLPDEIVCVGLNMQHELVWRTKLVHALFYTEDVLPPTEAQVSKSPHVQTRDGLETASERWDSRATSRQSHLLSTTPTPHRPAIAFESHNTPSRSFSSSTQDSRTQALFTATSEADYPVRPASSSLAASTLI